MNNFDFDRSNRLFSQSTEKLLETLRKELPPVFTRKVAEAAIGGLVSAKTLSNCDSLGKGPSSRVIIGNKVGYERDVFLAWLKERLR